VKVVAIHQPEYLPCLALLAKCARADEVVLLTDVQFTRDSLQQRARVVDAAGSGSWLSIPHIHHFGQRINEVVAVEPAWWIGRNFARLEHIYRGAPYRQRLHPLFQEVRANAVQPTILPAVEALMRNLLTTFGIVKPLLHACDLLLDPGLRKGERILGICKAREATHYLSGVTGATYLDRAAFAAAGIEILINDYKPPRYRYGIDAELHRVTGLDALLWLPTPEETLGFSPC